MNYIKNFTDFFSSSHEPDINEFSDAVQQDLRKSKDDFNKDSLTFDIEPVNVKEEIEEAKEYRIVRYSGTYIYGFQKNGIFHEIPNDLSTRRERKQNETGEVVFYINKKTNKIDTISESFAGNKWGEKKKHTYGFWIVVGTIFLIFYSP